MAFAYVKEYLRQPRDGVSSTIAAGQEPALRTQKIAIGAGSLQSLAFLPKTTFVCINVDATCSYEFGSSPVATVDSMRLPQDGTQYFGVVPGDRVAFIANS